MTNVLFDDLPLVWDNVYGGAGYFAGTVDGIVTVAGNPAQREIICFNAKTLEVVRTIWSFDNGHFIVPNLSLDYEYMLICRDYKVEYTPVGWDWRTPVTTLDYDGQQALLEQWANA